MTSSPDNAERLPVLRERVRHLEKIMRLLHQEVENFEELEDGRSALVEHLVFERKNIIDGRPQRDADAEAELLRMTTQHDRLRAAVASPEAIAEHQGRLTALEAELLVAEARGEELRGECAEKELALLNLAQQETELADGLRGEVEAAAQLAKASESENTKAIEQAQLRRQAVANQIRSLNQARAVFDAELEAREAQASAELNAAQGELEAARRRTKRIEQRTERLEVRHQRLRDRVHKLRDMVSKVVSNMQSHQEAGARIEAEPEVTPATTETDSTPVAAPAQNGVKIAANFVRSQAEQVANEPERRAFKAKLYAGARIELTSRFSSVTVVHRIDVELCGLLERADTLRELNQLAPTALRRDLVDHLCRYLDQGLIKLAGEP